MLQNCNIIKVAGVFYDEPTFSHYLKEISKKSKIAHTSVKSYLQKLKKLGIIKEIFELKGERKFPIYKADISNPFYRKYKLIYNLWKLVDSNLIAHLKDVFMPGSIVLFGSYRKGEDTENSDIDIFVECPPEKINLSGYEKKLRRKIQIHFSKNFKEYPAELKNNILNGIVMDGFLEVYK